MHLVYYTLGVCIVNGWLLYRRHCHQNGTFIQYIMHLEYALLMDVAVQKTLPPEWYMHLVCYALEVCIVNGCLLYGRHRYIMVHAFSIHALGVCIVNGWLLYRRHRQQNGTRIQHTTHLEYALLIDGGCIEHTASKMVHTFGILCTWSMHC